MSMAALQGYLLRHKGDPAAAIRNLDQLATESDAILTPTTKPLGTKAMTKLPQGATPGSVDWVRLLSSIIENSRPVKDIKQKKDKQNENVLSIVDSITSGLHQICSIDNPDTDTQASIWADMTKRELILSFRGTEQIPHIFKFLFCTKSSVASLRSCFSNCHFHIAFHPLENMERSNHVRHVPENPARY